MRELHKLFYPERIAFIGATENITKWGGYLLIYLMDGGFRENVYPVSIGRESVFGLPAYKSVLDIKEEIDLAIITIPAKGVFPVVEECHEKGIKNIVLVTSGFSETGEEGKRLEDELMAYVKEKDINLVGPNTMGILNSHASLYATGANVQSKKGKISLIAQSGNVGTQFLEWADQSNIGISKFVGSGNEGVLRSEDFLEYLADDEDTGVIVMYIEGVDDGRRFLEIAKKAAAKKPVVALKSGRTAAGSTAAASHTGSMAGSYRVFEAAMKQAGIVIVNSLPELLMVAAAFDSYPNPKGNRVGIITLGGGWGVVTADNCEERGLVLPELDEKIITELDKILPSFWSRGNPVDLVGMVNQDLYKKSTELMAESEDYDAVIVLGVINSVKFAEKTFYSAQRLGIQTPFDDVDVKKLLHGSTLDYMDFVIELMEKYDRPIYPVALVITEEDDIVHSKDQSRYKLILFRSPEEAVLCIAKQLEYQRYMDKRKDQ